MLYGAKRLVRSTPESAAERGRPAYETPPSSALYPHTRAIDIKHGRMSLRQSACLCPPRKKKNLRQLSKSLKLKEEPAERTDSALVVVQPFPTVSSSFQQRPCSQLEENQRERDKKRDKKQQLKLWNSLFDGYFALTPRLRLTTRHATSGRNQPHFFSKSIRFVFLLCLCRRAGKCFGLVPEDWAVP